MRKQQGLSLVELMISVTIGIILMTGVVQLFISSKVTFTTQQAMSRIQETGRLAIDFLARDIRMAGYMGCASRAQTTVQNGLDLSGNTDYAFDYDSDGDGVVNIAAGVEGYTDDDHPIDGVDVRNETDVLIVRTAGSTTMTVTEFKPENANFVVEGSEDSGCVGDVCVGDVAVLSDCTQGRLFQIVNVESVGNDGEAKVVHSMGGGSKKPPGNNSTKFGGQMFQPGAEVIKVSTIAYYIAEGASGEPSLWQRIDGEPPFELLEGIEDMNLTFGVGDTYEEADDVADWDNVHSVRVQLLVRSVEDNVITEPQQYEFAGVEVENPGDRRMRQVFSTTVAMRNRLQ